MLKFNEVDMGSYCIVLAALILVVEGCIGPFNVKLKQDVRKDVRFLVWTRENQYNYDILIWTSKLEDDLLNSHFDQFKKTKMLVHGYTGSGAMSWVLRAKDALLKHGRPVSVSRLLKVPEITRNRKKTFKKHSLLWCIFFSVIFNTFC